ncbi:hypothetical protein BUE93_20545 [Chromobacterium amazonense]|uniref:Uncharacterized protein n=1 Tax=Chromobacterium amazonense TaxID=1382803 RepID=A0A2S9WZ66_9NEIS|nr:RHS repeat-associated core domain-containing protein [Chromobacterium amazonense]PRP68765.1 hypothetical protein BUE93_20545 [Chromobacterium amazonense]
MPTPNLNAFHAGTPDITVLNPQGLPIRQLRYCRHQADGEAAERIEQQRYTPLGHPAAHIDARFFAAGGATCNFRYHTALAGQALHTQSIDAGDSWVLLNAEGQPHWLRDARGTEQRFAYDALGRLLSRSETLAGAPLAIRERLCYGDDAVDAAQRNLRGQRLQHYDTAGALDYGAGYSLTGQPLQETRQLLPVDVASHWEGDDEAQWQAELEPTPYMTRWQYGLNGQLLLQTDAQGHCQRMAYDVAGRLKASWVQLKDQAEQPVLLHISYSATGQKLCETAGNGVVTAYVYEAATQRLVGVTTTRPVQGDRKTLLQKLRYEYDPVGNITALYSDAEVARHYKNQRILPEKHYIYDSLYQLIQATGNENASLDSHHDDPSATTPLDSHHLVNYTRRYDYDAGGNLCQIQHRGAQSFTRQLTVSSHSNHALLHTEGLTPDTVRQRFDACGNQRQLDNGAALGWNGLNQLSHVITIDRDAQPDGERYQYAASQRIRKTVRTQASGATQHQEVIYLPGLELRRTTSGDIKQETLQVLSIGAAGRSQVRLLHWQAGQPADIANDQLRYSLDDHLGSCLLELDSHADIVTFEDYYPYGGTAVRSARNQSEIRYKTVRYSGKERDATGLYYYGYRYYQPWVGRWLSADPAGTVDGLSLYRMVNNNPVSMADPNGECSERRDRPPHENEHASNQEIKIRNVQASDVNITPHQNISKLGESHLAGLKEDPVSMTQLIEIGNVDASHGITASPKLNVSGEFMGASHMSIALGNLNAGRDVVISPEIKIAGSYGHHIVKINVGNIQSGRDVIIKSRINISGVEGSVDFELSIGDVYAARNVIFESISHMHGTSVPRANIIVDNIKAGNIVTISQQQHIYNLTRNASSAADARGSAWSLPGLGEPLAKKARTQTEPHNRRMTSKPSLIRRVSASW